MFISLFCAHTKAHSFKGGLEQIVLFTTNTKLALSLETQMVSYFHSLLYFSCFFFFKLKANCFLPDS